jgi:hypothetical protein
MAEDKYSSLSAVWYEGRMKASADEVASLEVRLEKKPQDAETRARLLGYYSGLIRGPMSASDKKAHLAHLLWFIERYPGWRLLGISDAGLSRGTSLTDYEVVKRAWLRAAVPVGGEDPTANVLVNAAKFLRHHDPTESAELFKQAVRLDPTSRDAVTGLIGAQHRRIRSRTGTKGSTALAIFRETEELLDLPDNPFVRRGELSSVANFAFDAGAYDKAEEYAELAVAAHVERPFQEGTPLHQAHIILGRVALRRGDTDRAKEELRSSASVPISIQLRVSGPSTNLCHELLEHGERQAVVEFLDHCADLCPFPAGDTLRSWADAIRRGGNPGFRPNIRN